MAISDRDLYFACLDALIPRAAHLLWRLGVLTSAISSPPFAASSAWNISYFSSTLSRSCWARCWSSYRCSPFTTASSPEPAPLRGASSTLAACSSSSSTPAWASQWWGFALRAAAKTLCGRGFFAGLPRLRQQPLPHYVGIQRRQRCVPHGAAAAQRMALADSHEAQGGR